MKKLLIAAASLVALNTAALADDLKPSYDFSGATNLGTITQGNGINAAILNQVATKDIHGDVKIEDAFQSEDMNDFKDQVTVSQLIAGDDIKDVVAAGDDIKTDVELEDVGNVQAPAGPYPAAQ